MEEVRGDRCLSRLGDGLAHMWWCLNRTVWHPGNPKVPFQPIPLGRPSLTNDREWAKADCPLPSVRSREPSCPPALLNCYPILHTGVTSPPADGLCTNLARAFISIALQRRAAGRCLGVRSPKKGRDARAMALARRRFFSLSAPSPQRAAFQRRSVVQKRRPAAQVAAGLDRGSVLALSGCRPRCSDGNRQAASALSSGSRST